MDAHDGSAATAPGDRSARDLLRRETAAAHRAVEALPRMRRLLHRQVTRDDYAAVLCGFLPVHGGFEPRAAALAGWSPGCGGERLRALQADLRQLGREPVSAALPPAPALHGRAAALGACYVLEGSFLGGAVIAQHLRRQLGDATPLRYFAGAGIDVGGRWQAFLALLEAGLAAPGERAQALCAARRSYHWLATVLP